MSKREYLENIQTVAQTLYTAKKNYYSKNFYEFNRDVLKWPDIYEPLHRKVCDFITNNINTKKLLLLLPRGTFKSSIVTVGYSLYRIANNPNERILIANATRPMAVQFLSQIKNHLQRNDEYKKIFGDLSQTADSWREDRIYVAREKSYEQKEPTVWAQGIESNVVGSHFDLAILDDVVARENISSKEQIDKVKNFYKDALDLIDAEKGHKKVIIIGTTWHWDDLYQWIQDDLMEDFEMMRLPAYQGEWGEGELLLPTRLSWKVLKELKKQQGNAHFSAQYMLDPIPEEDQTFRGPFRYYEETDLKGIELKKFITCDPAISEEKTADYSALVCVGVDKNNDWYILDIWRDRVQPKKLIDQIFYWNEKWKPVSIGIETIAFQKALQYFINDEMKRRNQFIPLKELGNTDRSKDERIRGLQPRYELGSVFHPQKTANSFVDDLEDELLRFPRGKNDDLIDALASCLELAFPPKVKEQRNTVKRAIYPA
jgi:predicted phage terminase large subunit-like protein